MLAYLALHHQKTLTVHHAVNILLANLDAAVFARERQDAEAD